MKNILKTFVIVLNMTTISNFALPFCCSAQPTDCQKFLKSFLLSDPVLSSIEVTMVTLNNKGVASFTITRLYYIPGKRLPNGNFIPGAYKTLETGEYGIDQPKFDFGKQVQVFSDRYGKGEFTGTFVGLKGHSAQKFDLNNADDLDFEITDEPEVQVNIYLRSWDNAKITFPVTCQEGGFLQGQTPDVKYTLYIKRWGE